MKKNHHEKLGWGNKKGFEYNLTSFVERPWNFLGHPIKNNHENQNVYEG